MDARGSDGVSSRSLDRRAGQSEARISPELRQAVSEGMDPLPSQRGSASIRAQRRHDPLIGQVFAERYCASALLADSGMARLYHGHDLLGGVPCVLKLTRDPQDESACLLLRREALVTAQVPHAHIVKLYHHGELPPFGPYVVTEYVPGPSLAVLLRRGPLPITPALLLGVQIASALHAIHRRGIEHRDVKPTNILVEGDMALLPRAKLIDFGIAGCATGDDSRLPDMLYGTPEYVAPERIKGEAAGPLADQYSFGCLLYEMLTGRPPYVGETAITVMQRHLRESPVPPHELRKDEEISRALEYVVLRAMTRDPRERFESMAVLCTALMACLGETARHSHLAHRGRQNDGPY